MITHLRGSASVCAEEKWGVNPAFRSSWMNDFPINVAGLAEFVHDGLG